MLSQSHQALSDTQEEPLSDTQKEMVAAYCNQIDVYFCLLLTGLDPKDPHYTMICRLLSASKTKKPEDFKVSVEYHILDSPGGANQGIRNALCRLNSMCHEVIPNDEPATLVTHFERIGGGMNKKAVSEEVCEWVQKFVQERGYSDIQRS